MKLNDLSCSVLVNHHMCTTLHLADGHFMSAICPDVRLCTGRSILNNISGHHQRPESSSQGHMKVTLLTSLYIESVPQAEFVDLLGIKCKSRVMMA